MWGHLINMHIPQIHFKIFIFLYLFILFVIYLFILFLLQVIPSLCPHILLCNHSGRARLPVDCMEYQGTIRPCTSHYIQTGKDNPTWGMGFQKPVKVPRTVLLPLLGVLPIDQTVTYIHNSKIVTMYASLFIQTLCSMSQTLCFDGHSWNVLNFLISYNSSFSSAGFPSLAQCKTMGLWICPLQSLDEGSQIKTGIVNNLFTGVSQFRLFTHCYQQC